MAKMNDKGGKSSGKKFMDNGVGLCAYRDNPMSQPKRTKAECGPGLGMPANSDQRHANKLLQKAQRDVDSLRGMNGM